MRVQLKGLHKVKSKGRTYFYLFRGGPRVESPAPVGSPDFMRAYNIALESAKPQPTGNVAELIRLFESSIEFTRLAERTQADYKKYLTAIDTKFGKMPIKALAARNVRGVFKQWRDKIAKKSLRRADYAWSILQRVLSVAEDRGRIDRNPCKNAGRLYKAERTDKIWTDENVISFLAKAPPHLHLALMLALWTGQRQGDLLRLRWSAYDGQKIRLRQSKGGRRVVIPVGAPLKAMLDGAPRVTDTILATMDKTSWTSSGFRASWRKGCAKAEVTGVTFHDLRGSAVTRLALVGCSVPEIASFTGHSLADVNSILDAHYLSRDQRMAESALAKLEQAA